MGDRHTVAGAHATETPAFHGTRKPLALRAASDVNLLADNEVIRRNHRANRHERIRAVNAELGKVLLEADTCLGKVLALRLGDILMLGFARTQLKREITIPLEGAVSNHLAILQRKNSHGHMLPVLSKEAGHPDFLGDNASAHRLVTPQQRHPADHLLGA
jgi:hypothetical protein